MFTGGFSDTLMVETFSLIQGDAHALDAENNADVLPNTAAC